MHPKKVYLFNKKIDSFIFVASLVVLLLLSLLLRVYYVVKKDSKSLYPIENITESTNELDIQKHK